MQSLNTILPVDTLCAIIEEIEPIEPNNAALPQLRFALNQALARQGNGAERSCRRKNQGRRMSIYPSHDLIPSLRAMCDKTDCDPAPRTPSLTQLYRLIVRQVENEAAATITKQGSNRAV